MQSQSKGLDSKNFELPNGAFAICVPNGTDWKMIAYATEHARMQSNVSFKWSWVHRDFA